MYCLQSEKPYQCPKFNIRKLAELLETNTTYVSKALNVFGEKKFNQLVNELRIEQVKNDIVTNEHQKFTLEYIYTRAGFRQQSTFNRMFKEQTGMTPSDFIDSYNDIEISN
ncbi:helix-turn-helix domain-containing protein [Chryseobacterium sp. PBS4-4]|uniref:Helix-turn-helix domain-containing protein n=1 Tax=Chryseobacterium edaphi TaxID=2976532 RepID=A0ABT2W6X3_9FLAO|nr:helix-turn-helix domain-containing protein [Chryseobacterium edaphi]MCU7617949.1 helix-turn-helix domain-containing protein [Chryseobacterium edaphi]